METYKVRLFRMNEEGRLDDGAQVTFFGTLALYELASTPRHRFA